MVAKVKVWYLHTKYELNMTQNKIKVLSCMHNNKVCGWCLSSQETSIANMTSIRLRTKELLRFYSGCHGNWVTIATRYVADVYCLKEPLYQIWTQYDSKRKTFYFVPYLCWLSKSAEKWLFSQSMPQTRDRLYCPLLKVFWHLSPGAITNFGTTRLLLGQKLSETFFCFA